MAAILKIRSSTSEQFQNLLAIKGDKGDKGDTGTSFVVKGYYDTIEELEEEVPSPSVGDVYGVGTAAPYSIYVWDNTNSEWVNNGNLQGAKGDTGATGATGAQGPTGPAGNDGISPTIEVQAGTSGITLTITDKNGTKTAEVSNGAAGATGATGAQGPYFTPSVDSSGNLSWTNNGGLVNPNAVNIKGPTGASPVRGTDYWTTADKDQIVAEASASVTPATIGAITDPATKSDGQVLQYEVIDGVGAWKAKNQSGSVASVNGQTGTVTTRLLFTDITVAASAFTQMVTPTYSAYPYQASIGLQSVDTTMSPQVIFDGDDASSGLFAPIADTYSGGIYIYASSAPSASIAIPVIILWK